MEFVEGASRLKGSAKALDIWRIETKIEADCVDFIMESIHTLTPHVWVHQSSNSHKVLFVDWGIREDNTHRNDFAGLFERILDIIIENENDDNDNQNEAMTMMLIIMMMHDNDNEGFNHDDDDDDDDDGYAF